MFIIGKIIAIIYPLSCTSAELIIEEQTIENTNEYRADCAPVLEFEDDDVSDSDAVCKQELLSVDCIDTWQDSRVLELKLVKYVRQSPTTQHTATEEHVGDKGKCAGEQSVENDDKKPQYKSHKEQPSCDVCLKMFSAKSRLLSHIRTHTGEKRFTCDICEKRFSVKSNLNRHLVIHTGEKPYNCDICKKKFVRKCHLNAHLVIHTGEKPYSCDICQKKFLTRSQLKKHFTTIYHIHEKYNCSICQRKFTSWSYLKRHSVIHTGEKS